jgi:hypothetical protein
MEQRARTADETFWTNPPAACFEKLRQPASLLLAGAGDCAALLTAHADRARSVKPSHQPEAIETRPG